MKDVKGAVACLKSSDILQEIIPFMCLDLWIKKHIIVRIFLLKYHEH